MTAQQINYSNFYESTVASTQIGSSDTAFDITAVATSNGTDAINAPYYIVVDPDTASKREVMLVTNVAGTTLTVERDKEGRHSTDPVHAQNTVVRMAVVGEMFEDMHDQITDGAITIKNKVIQDFTETVYGSSASVSGNLDIDVNNGNIHTVTLTESVTGIDFLNLPTSGMCVVQILFTQPSSQSYTVALNAITINGAGAVTGNTSGNGGITITANPSTDTVDILTFAFVNGGTPHITAFQDSRNA